MANAHHSKKAHSQRSKKNDATHNDRAFDVVIIGGAMTGATLAFALEHYLNTSFCTEKSKPLSIAVIESEEPNPEHSGFDARSIALSYGSCQQLDKIKLWEKIAPHHL